MPRTYTVQRIEKRVPIEVAVHICGDERTPGVEETFTENVSARGARVITARRWRINDLLMLASAPGNFQTIARVAYCQPRQGEGFAIGLEFLEPAGSWVVHP
jgi:hypothetical protein